MKVAIVGAGMAGLSCAAALGRAGAEVTLFEKSRGLGGRLATRRNPHGSFDHGAQYVTARTPSFQAFIADAGTAGHAAVWSPEGRSGREPWWRGRPGMSGLARALSTGTEIRQSARLQSVSHDPGTGWTLGMDGGETQDGFDTLALTIPAPQLRELEGFDASAFTALDQVRIAPCWSVMVAFRNRVGGVPEVARPDRRDLAWSARQSTPDGDGAETENWVLQAGPEWSAEHLEDAPETIIRALLAAFAEHAGEPLPDVAQADAHRWRYARVTTPAGEPCLWDPESRLGLAGDWCLGGRVEAAFLSGETLAGRILAPVLA